MTTNKDELEHFVQRVIEDFPQEDGYPSNIIDQVFYTIEQNTLFLHRYKRLVKNTKKGKLTINPWIGKLVKQYTEMENDKDKVPAQLSSLIETYTELK